MYSIKYKHIMPLDRLYVNVINNGTDKELILTKNILVYNTKTKLEVYPFIHSSSTYKYSTINSLSYDEKIEVFFNKSKFITFLTDKTADDFDKNILNKNFEFTIKSIFSPNMGFASYKQSMSYYDLRFTPSISTFGYNFMNMNKYTYININGTIYTITSNIWLNDALNIPIYRNVIKKYYDSRDEISSVKKLQRDNENNTEILLNLISLDITYNIQELNKPNRSNTTDKYIIQQDDGNINKNIETVLDDFKLHSYNKLLYIRSFQLNDDNTFTSRNKRNPRLIQNFIEFIKNNNNITNTLKHPRKERFHMLIEYILKNMNSIEQEKYVQIKKFINHFINEISKSNGLKSQLLYFLRKHQTNTFEKINIKFFLQFKEIFVKLEDELSKITVFNFINSGGKDKSFDFNNKYFKEQFPNFSSFIDTLVDIGKQKNVSNKQWRKVIDSHNNELPNYQEDDDDKDNENIFDYIMKCFKNNEDCTNSLKPSKYMHFSLDTIIKDDKNLKSSDISTVYEGYIRLNLVKGKIDNKTFTKELKCDYYDNYQNIQNDPNDNNDLLDMQLVSFEDKIKKQTKDNNQKEKMKDSNEKKNKTIKSIKKGGKKRKSKSKSKTKRYLYK